MQCMYSWMNVGLAGQAKQFSKDAAVMSCLSLVSAYIFYAILEQPDSHIILK